MRPGRHLLELLQGQSQKTNLVRLQPPGHKTRAEALESGPGLSAPEFQIQTAKQLPVPLFEVVPIFKRRLQLGDLKE